MRLKNTKFAWMLLCCFIVAQQAIAQVAVSGKVTDQETGLPLAGATVKELDSQASVTTNEDGMFTLSVSSAAATLVVSYIGYQSQEIILAGRRNVDIALLVGDGALDEVVVVGYGTQKKVHMTGAVSTVQSKELVQVPTANVSEALIGKAPGLFAKQNTGVPGADFANLSIRGYDAPLVLVDGVEASWTRMDPNEIESVTVLKDAAAAVYGARAGNGVILITTKRGKEGKPTIALNSNYTVQSPTTVPEFVPSWKFAELLREGELNNALPFTFSPEEIQKFKDGNDPDYVNEDWYKAAFVRWAPMHGHTLTVNGGTERVKYHLTAGYLNQSSIYKSGDLSFNRYNVRSNVDAQISKRLGVSFDLSYRNEERLSPQIAVNNLWTNLVTSQPIWPATLPDPTMGGAYSGFLERSPVAQTIRNMTGSEDDIQRYLMGRINLNYEIPGIEGLRLNAALNYSINNLFNKVQDRPFRIYSYDHTSGEYEERGINGANSLDEQFSQYTQLYPLVSLNYNQDFGDHAVQGLLLAEGIDTDYFFTSAGRMDLLSVEIPYLFAGSTENIRNNGGASQTGRVSYVGRGNYAYKDKYMLEGTFRFDASHKFPPESRWGFFPSVSAAWRLSEESFIKDHVSWINNLKLRASYSKAGNDNVEAFRYLTGYEILRGVSNVYMFGTDVYQQIRSTGLPNPNITWLDMTSYNLGLEATFKDGLFGFEFDAFRRITDNIFGQPLETYPSTFGAMLPQLNINSTEDRGIEFTLNHRNRVGNGVNYNVSVLMSLARQKYRRWSESPYEDADEVRIYQLTGKYTNRWIGYLSEGIFMSQDEIDNHPINQDQAENTTLVPGDIKYKDLNGDEIIDWRDQDEIGYGTFPDLTYGLNLGVEYKGFSVTALFQGASMFNSMITGPLRGPLQNLSNPFDFHYQYRWQPDPNNLDVNINPNAKLPAIRGDGLGANTNNNRASDFWLQDATYVRLRNLNLNYTIPTSLVRHTGLQQINIFVAGSNLLTFSTLGIYKGSVDPEATDGQKLYPPVKSVSFGINLTL